MSTVTNQSLFQRCALSHSQVSLESRPKDESLESQVKQESRENEFSLMEEFSKN